ncbi:hypothetical protein CUMW_097290 [Citrus unshiu]|uniref:Endoplasmic reticulum transmembrane protein n=1 Tax=Citrus unshiu TaxID=55188 RepID=A0A2H5P2Y7_CITUN|nr:hypothetical protein CUMW_097290 [Citrus unshiu]
MIYLLFKIVFTEMALILTLLFRNPLRKFVIMGLDRLKRGRGPLVAKSVGATVLVVLCSAVYSAMEIQRRAREGGAINPTDEVLMANLLLQASLMDIGRSNKPKQATQPVKKEQGCEGSRI